MISASTVALWLLIGESKIESSKDPGPVVPKGTLPRVTKRPGNIKGNVLILMYHKVGDKEANMVRSRDNFKKDLARLYKMGYRPVTLEEYANRKIKLPVGASPVVITFDDSHESQFSYLPDGSINPKSAVGIWYSFAKKHSDFPVKGTWFVLPNGPFGQKGLGKKKLEWLDAQGSEIASHTLTHRPLNKISDYEVTKELGGSYRYLLSLGYTPKSMALPYGILPKNRELLKSVIFEGRTYAYQNIVLAGSDPAPSPYSAYLRRLRISRVNAYEGPLGVTFWLNRVSNGKIKPFVQP